MDKIADTIPSHTVENALRIRQLEKQLAWYRSFFENAADAVLVVQPETWCILDANPQAATLLGIPHEELLGSTIPQFRRIFKLLTKSASPTVLSELSVDTPDLRSVMMEVSARFVQYDNQQLIQAIARDVSEQRALTDKLVQADKLVLLGQLSAGVAHEIRNPLAAINLNLQMLQRKTPEGVQHTYINSALQGVERISKIVEATLNFSRSTLPVIRQEQLNNIIISSLDLVAPALKRKTISVRLDLTENMPGISIDASQIQQVFINLLTNAADAIKAKGQIVISTYDEPTARGDGRLVVTSIQDNGAGIQPDDLSKIFNPFFTKKAEGTGLGLPISQRIIHQHNGVIEVESIPNQGTTFYIKLPVAYQ